MKKLREWDEASVTHITQYLEEGTHRALAHWMLTTPSSPFQYLPKDWWHALDTGPAFCHILETMEHKGVWFALVNKSPRVVFTNPEEDDFEGKVLEPNDLALLERREIIRGAQGDATPVDALVEVLAIPSCQFGAFQEQHEIKQYKRAFAFEAAKFGVETAQNRAKGTPYSCDNWPEELASEIAKYKKALVAAQMY